MIDKNGIGGILYMSDLILVESKTKAEEIRHFLKNVYEVEPTFGHIIDLPVKGGMGIPKNADGSYDFDNVEYVVIDNKKEVVKKIKAKSKGAKVLIASDPDREGEAIAYHVHSQIKNLAKSTTRVEFHSITPEGVAQGMKNSRNIDQNLVAAQMARRYIDRLVGFELTKFAANGMGVDSYAEASVGRVQSAVLKLVYDREMIIRNFKPEPYFKVFFKDDFGTEFASSPIRDEKVAEELFAALKSSNPLIIKIEKKRTIENPPPPLKASTLQKNAHKKEGWNSEKTMDVAQKLFEKGFISYHRTDSERLSPETQGSVLKYIKTQYPECYTDNPSKRKNNSKIQDAHECIHPTEFSVNKDPLKTNIINLTEDEKKLYKLIWVAFIVSQSASATWNETKLTLGAKNQKENLTASGKVLAIPGWRTIEPSNDKSLPEYKEQQSLTGVPQKKQEFTKPPARLNNGTLLEEMEKNMIGRPATYAPSIMRVLDKDYFYEDGAAYKLTDKGEKLIHLLEKMCPEIINLEFTANMEEDLDKIALGELSKNELLKNFTKIIQKGIKAGQTLRKGEFAFLPREGATATERRKFVPRTTTYQKKPETKPTSTNKSTSINKSTSTNTKSTNTKSTNTKTTNTKTTNTKSTTSPTTTKPKTATKKTSTPTNTKNNAGFTR